MLSNTRGYTKRSRVIGRRLDDATLRNTMCPSLRARGFCAAYERENAARMALAGAKEAELQRRATALCDLEAELLPNPTDRATAIAAALHELRAETSYQHWSLDTAVAEHMATRRQRRCPFAHHSIASLRRAAKHTLCGPLNRSAMHEDAVRRQKSRAETERRRLFARLSTLQKCVVCLLWQRRFEAPLAVLCDVRRRMEAQLESLSDTETELDASAVAAEGARVVTVITARPALGVVDLSSLPHLMAYMAQQQASSVIHPETMAYFTTSTAPIVPRGWTEKEFDLSTTAGAHEVMEAIAWTLRLLQAQQAETPDEDPAEQARIHESHSKNQHPHKHSNNSDDNCHRKTPKESREGVILNGSIPLRSLILRRCDLTSADAIIAALRKNRLDTALLALDLSDNRLMSLRCLFALRAHFAERLLRLSLADNPITRKPEYREQVRQSLPRLTSLDGATIRRPPLALPRQTPSYTFSQCNDVPNSRHLLSSAEREAVVDSLARFVYIWENRRIPWTALEQRRLGGKRWRGANHLLPPEEEFDEESFHHRYLHPSATFSMTVEEGLTLFDPITMRLAAEVELDETFAGMRLAPLDLRDVRVFDVSVKANARNLLLGRSILHRVARGSLNCCAAYRYSIYPERLTVRHNFAGALLSVAKVTDTSSKVATIISSSGGTTTSTTTTTHGTNKGNPNKTGSDDIPTKNKKNRVLDKNGSQTCNVAVVDAAAKNKPIHSNAKGCPNRHKESKEKHSRVNTPTLTNTTPTAAMAMPFSCGVVSRKPVFYLATLHGLMTWRAPSMRRSECIVAAYDRVLTLVENALPPTNAVERRRSAPLLVFNDALHLRPPSASDREALVAQSAERVARLVVEYGLESCADGEPLARAVMERATSDAAAAAALQTLVFGAPNDEAEKSEWEEEEDEEKEKKGDEEEVNGEDDALWYFDIFSLLVDDDAADSYAAPHRVTLTQLSVTVEEMNRRYTLAFATNAEE